MPKTPRNFSAPYSVDSFETYLASSSLTLATCWKLTPDGGGAAVGATSHTRNLTLTAHGSTVFKSTQGIIPSAVDAEAGLTSAGLEIDSVFSVGDITEEDIAAGDWDSAFFEVFIINYEIEAMGEYVMFAGYIGEVQTLGFRFKAEGRPLSAKSDQSLTEKFVPKCVARNLGDAKCKVVLGLPAAGDGTVATGSVTLDSGASGSVDGITVDGVEITDGTGENFDTDLDTTAVNVAANITAHTSIPNYTAVAASSVVTITALSGATNGHVVTSSTTTIVTTDADISGGAGYITFNGTVTTGGSNIQFSDSNITEADDYFSFGVITFDTGTNAGRSVEIKSYVSAGGVFNLSSAVPQSIDVGDTFTVIRGCDRLVSTCGTAYDNVINFRGFPLVPGIEEANKQKPTIRT